MSFALLLLPITSTLSDSCHPALVVCYTFIIPDLGKKPFQNGEQNSKGFFFFLFLNVVNCLLAMLFTIIVTLTICLLSNISYISGTVHPRLYYSFKSL